MLVIVVVFNVLLSLLCLYVAWQIWNIRRALAVTAELVSLFERNTYNVLHGAPEGISQGQLGVKGLRGSYQNLETQVQQLQRVLLLLGLIQRILPTTLAASTRLRRRNRSGTLFKRSLSRRLRGRRSRK
ncbi:MAG TPA: hypothetical protein V6C91_19150 [Coleofasciculaceae cyanobacterium]